MTRTALAMLAELWVLAIFTLVSVNGYNNNVIVEAHNFSPNSLSTFISLAHEADVELSLAGSNFPSNITLALYHGKNAVELMNDAYRSDDEIIDDTDFVKKYNEAQNSKNATIQALVVANIVDQILREYGQAIGIRYDMTNMSNMNMTMMQSGSDPDPRNSSLYSMNEPVHSNIEEDNINSTIINPDNYQSAQKLSERVSLIFNDQLIPVSKIPNKNNRTAINTIYENLNNLGNLVNNKASAQDMMTLVHMKIHPALQATYNLKLKQ